MMFTMIRNSADLDQFVHEANRLIRQTNQAHGRGWKKRSPDAGMSSLLNPMPPPRVTAPAASAGVAAAAKPSTWITPETAAAADPSHYASISSDDLIAAMLSGGEGLQMLCTKILRSRGFSIERIAAMVTERSRRVCGTATVATYPTPNVYRPAGTVKTFDAPPVGWKTEGPTGPTEAQRQALREALNRRYGVTK